MQNIYYSNLLNISKINKNILTLLSFITLSIYSQDHIPIEPNLTEQNLLFFIQQNYTPENIPNYNSSRDIILSILDQFNNQISCVYSGYTIDMIGGYCNCENANDICNETNSNEECNNNNGNWILESDPSVEAYYKDINIEHTWPRSKGAEYGNPKSDMHHLFPTKSNINSSRGNDPFADIPDSETHKWYRNTEILYDIPLENIEQYAEKFNPENQPEMEKFEPKEEHKGNVARAMFYFFAIYNDSADVEFWNIQKPILIDWHYNDPVDNEEFERTELISEYQDDLINPFILDSTLARRIWYYNEISSNPNVSFNMSQLYIEESNLEIPIQLNYQNPNFIQDAIIQINFFNSTINNEEFSLSQSLFTFSNQNPLMQELIIFIEDDEIYEGFEKLILEIEIISSSDDFEIGNPGIFILNIHENDLPKVVITEVMINPQNISDSEGEWFEIFIENEIPINFKNWLIKDNDTDDFLILENHIIQNYTYAVFSKNSNPNSNGGILNAIEYDEINLANNGDEIHLVSPEGFTADSIWWDNGVQFPFGNGTSMALIDYRLDNLNPTNWQESNLIFSSGDFGTPGLENCFHPEFYDECGICGGDGQSCSLLLGDVNSDNIINIVDIIILVGYILGNELPNNNQLYVSDINQDSVLNVVDIIQIIDIILTN